MDMWVMMLEGVKGENMKLNQKLFNQIKSEPFLTQVVQDKTVEIHLMNQTPLFETYAKKGRFSLWTSNGTTYKLLLEESYYEHMKPFYSEEVNNIWLNFLEEVTKTNKKISYNFLIPILGLYLIVAIISTLFFQEQIAIFFLVVIAIVFFSNTVQNRKIKENIQKQNEATQEKIQNVLGKATYEELVVNQEKHYRSFFNIQDEVQNNGENNAK